MGKEKGNKLQNCLEVVQAGAYKRLSNAYGTIIVEDEHGVKSELMTKPILFRTLFLLFTLLVQGFMV